MKGEFVMNIKAPDLQQVEQWIVNAQIGICELYPITIVTDAIIGMNLNDHSSGGKIRVPSIRGHLRFWWRATRGAEYKNAIDLKAKERQIFGDTSLPSPCKIKISSVKRVEQSISFFPPYISFPYRDQGEKSKDQNEQNKQPNFAQVLEAAHNNRGCSFDLQIEYTDSIEFKDGQKDPHIWLSAEQVKSEVEAALWAWINFGGIGARTRRGCGSLYSKCFSPNVTTPDNLEKWFKTEIIRHELPSLSINEYREWPVLGLLAVYRENIVVQKKPDMIKKVWEETIKTYFKFRHRRNRKQIIGNDNRAKSVPTRSHWPEPDALRRISLRLDRRHEDPVSLNKEDDIAFPRAQFGMPITFWFKDQKDPLKTELVPANKERLASPLILKPLAVGNGRAFGAMIRLIQPPIECVKLRYVADKTKNASEEEAARFKNLVENYSITKPNIYPERITSSVYPLKNSGPDAIKGFLNSEEVEKWKNHQQPSKR